MLSFVISPFQGKNPLPDNQADALSAPIFAVLLLLLLAGFVFCIWLRKRAQKNSSQQRPQEPIFPQGVHKDPSIDLLWEQQRKIRKDGLIDAGIQVENIEIENGVVLVRYTSIEPAKEVLPSFRMGKPIYITVWFNLSGKQGKEMARVRVKIHKQSKEDIISGRNQEVSFLEFLQFDINTEETPIAHQLADIFLDHAEKWAEQFEVDEISGNVAYPFKGNFQKRSYQIHGGSHGQAKITKSFSRKK